MCGEKMGDQGRKNEQDNSIGLGIRAIRRYLRVDWGSLQGRSGRGKKTWRKETPWEEAKRTNFHRLRVDYISPLKRSCRLFGEIRGKKGQALGWAP